MSRVRLLAVVAAVFGSLGCGASGSPDVESVHYVGSAGTDGSRVVFVPAAPSPLFYVCGTGPDLAATTHWFAPTFASSTLSATDGGWKLSGRWDGVRYAGQLTRPDGSTHDWSATPVTETDPAGLYSHSDDAGRTGVIVISGSTMSAQGAWMGAGAFASVTPVRSLEASRNAFDVQVALSTGAKTVRVKRVNGFQ